MVLFCYFGSAQITQKTIDTDTFRKSGFPFKGKRVLMVENISSSNEENYFVFSKNEKNATNDKLFIQQFTKVNGKWSLKVSEVICEPHVVTSVWNTRKSFADIEKDGKTDAIFVYSKHPKDDLSQQLEVVQLLFYKNNLYTISSESTTNYTNDFFSENFKNLPKAVNEYALSFWNRLDKF